MTIRGLLVRFLLAYLGLLLLVGLIVSAMGINSSSINTAVMLGAIVWACMSYGKKNGHYLNRSEKRKVWLGIVGIDLALQCVFALLILPSLKGNLPWGILLGTLAFVALLHAAIAYFFVGFSGKLLAKQGVISEGP